MSLSAEGLGKSSIVGEMRIGLEAGGRHYRSRTSEKGIALGNEWCILPCFRTKLISHCGSFFCTLTSASTTLNEAAYHGPGNLDSGWKNRLYTMRENSVAKMVVSTAMAMFVSVACMVVALSRRLIVVSTARG